ncbi:Oxo-4-hydroxy-4-carboxy-5-ureidoimidazoline decarboxylase [Metarhizium rileyi]|uniref:Oxo-4-hydroxy-4-carboxy-5-ureidoimidazoline decarboxylase n=1 Tax=Metarhizium rileyi (strain RCEF 4871) TaxID=1649241 RepID=A0A167CAD3_METRR|nr:Oxo-4-hydroxy-4-carboxy-5-ureidoimidazoline decarboxylase [Metarhizium rileyi RCEF 4871]
MAQKLPKVDDLPFLSEAAQTNTLDLLFEPDPAIHSILLPVVKNARYSSYPQLIDECRSALFDLAVKSTPSRSKPNRTLLSVLGSHPRLGSKKVDSTQSAAEQANLRGEGEHLAELNQEYEEKFPGLRFVAFVNGRGRPDIMHEMRIRIDRGDFSKEVDMALEAMCDIAKDRASKLLT